MSLTPPPHWEIEMEQALEQVLRRVDDSAPQSERGSNVDALQREEAQSPSIPASPFSENCVQCLRCIQGDVTPTSKGLLIQYFEAGDTSFKDQRCSGRLPAMEKISCPHSEVEMVVNS